MLMSANLTGKVNGVGIRDLSSKPVCIGFFNIIVF